MKKLLLTGFEAFAGYATNPTESLVMSLNKQTINELLIHSYILPVEYDRSFVILDKIIDTINPDIIISLGLASDRHAVTPELIAINYQHCEIPDNTGLLKQYQKIDPKAKESFFSTLPIEEFITALQAISLPAQLSTSAGSYVCNTIMYQTLRKLAQAKKRTKAGFIHIPLNLSHEDLLTGLIACIKTL